MRRRLSRQAPPAGLLAALVATFVLTGSVPAHDRGGDGHRFDDDPAGTIASFDAETRMLTIDLARGGMTKGVVTRLTWIKCDEDEDGEAFDRRRLTDDDGDGSWHDHDCPTSSLREGAVVDDALLVLRDGRALFWKVDLEE